MHEFSICQQIISQVETLVDEHHAINASRIQLRIGPLSGIDVRLLKQAFRFACAATVAEAAELDIEECPIIVKCKQCGATSQFVSAAHLVCSHCGDINTQLISGDEMLLVAVDLNHSNVTTADGIKESGHV